jgi:hypothetical protein
MVEWRQSFTILDLGTRWNLFVTYKGNAIPVRDPQSCEIFTLMHLLDNGSEM